MTKQNTSNSSYLAHKFFPWALNRLLFLRMRYLKWTGIFKKWFNRFFLFSGMKIEFFMVNWMEITIICTLLRVLDIKKKLICLFVCLFSSEM